MEKYLERARELRAIVTPHYNCAQSVLLPFAETFGMSEDEVMRIAVHFGRGMKMGSVCGAVTGGLMALGLAGLDSAGAANAFTRKIRENHAGALDCKDLLKANAQAGGEPKAHCDGMVYEAVEAVYEILRENGKIPYTADEKPSEDDEEE